MEKDKLPDDWKQRIFMAVSQFLRDEGYDILASQLDQAADACSTDIPYAPQPTSPKGHISVEGLTGSTALEQIQKMIEIHKQGGMAWGVALSYQSMCVIEDALLKRAPPQPPEKADIVYTVYVSGDETNHIFSTQEKAQVFADTQESPCVLSEYLIDNPERFYGRQN